VSALLSTAAIETVNATPAGAATPGLGADFDCSSASVYGVVQAGTIYGMSTSAIAGGGAITTTAASTALAGATGLNALAIAPGGADAFGIDTGNGNIWEYAAVAETWTKVGTAPTSNSIKGAVDPINGNYYFGTSANVISEYNTTTNTVIPTVLTVTPAGTGNGDLTFDGAGNMYLVSDKTLADITAAQVAAGGTQASTTITTALAYDSNGIAFNSAGGLFLSDSNNVYEVNPLTGAQIGTTATVTPTLVDMASCSYNPTLTLKKSLPSRYASTDQFVLTVTGGGISSDNTATTTGTATGVQSKYVGPLPALDGTTYTFTETAAATTPATSLANYVTTYSCIDTANGNAPLTTTAISTTSFSLNLPTATGANGQDAVCTFTNTPLPQLQVQKALGGSRFSANDQFTTQIRSGSATGPVISTGANATTTGTGSTVTAGTGNSGIVTGTAGTSYWVTEAVGRTWPTTPPPSPAPTPTASRPASPTERSSPVRR